MAKKPLAVPKAVARVADAKRAAGTHRASSLVDTRVIYCGDNLEQLQKLPGDFVSILRTRFRAAGTEFPLRRWPG